MFTSGSNGRSSQRHDAARILARKNSFHSKQNLWDTFLIKKKKNGEKSKKKRERKKETRWSRSKFFTQLWFSYVAANRGKTKRGEERKREQAKKEGERERERKTQKQHKHTSTNEVKYSVMWGSEEEVKLIWLWGANAARPTVARITELEGTKWMSSCTPSAKTHANARAASKNAPLMIKTNNTANGKMAK